MLCSDLCGQSVLVGVLGGGGLFVVEGEALGVEEGKDFVDVDGPGRRYRGDGVWSV